MTKNKNLYRSTQRLKIIFTIVALAIAMAAIFFTNRLAKLVAIEEKKKIEIWAEAQQLLSITDTEDNLVIDLVFKIIEGNTNIPVISYFQGFYDSRNVRLPLQESEESNDEFQARLNEFYAQLIERFRSKHPPIVLNVFDYELLLYYDESFLLKQLYYFPYVLLTVVLGFILIAFFAFGSAKKAEQNQVWVGLSKETAHQLGTPISSLLAWSELLKSKYPDDNLIAEMERDIDRLRTIAERFSKVGSIPDMEPVNLHEVLNNAVQYVKKRSSKKVNMQCHFSSQEPIFVELNTQLFDWVIENICKNAIDAMDGVGQIDVNVQKNGKNVIIDITDTGKGLNKKQFKAIFTPGYTTKSRGWGLGLSLTKRIVEEYHKGKIFVKQSILNGGTTFRIVLKARV